MKPFFCVIALTAAIAAGAGQTSDPRREVEGVFQKAGFSAAELATLQTGATIAHADAAGTGDVVTQAAVKIRVPHAQVVAYDGQYIAYAFSADFSGVRSRLQYRQNRPYSLNN